MAKDRYNRKYGIAVDTAGAIAQALERAYRDGLRDEPGATLPAPEQDDAGPLEWALIPPRPRDAFWSICLHILGRDASQQRDGFLAPSTTERGTPGWKLVLIGYSPDRVIGDRSIAPLVRLGLIELEAPGRMIVTARGTETWALFCRRGGQYPEDLTDYAGRCGGTIALPISIAAGHRHALCGLVRTAGDNRMSDQIPELPAGGFIKQDTGNDLASYASPRLVTHIDEGAIAALTRLYRDLLPHGARVLDV